MAGRRRNIARATRNDVAKSYIPSEYGRLAIAPRHSSSDCHEVDRGGGRMPTRAIANLPCSYSKALARAAQSYSQALMLQVARANAMAIAAARNYAREVK